jgi:hypothetical protein
MSEAKRQARYTLEFKLDAVRLVKSFPIAPRASLQPDVKGQRWVNAWTTRS